MSTLINIFKKGGDIQELINEAQKDINKKNPESVFVKDEKFLTIQSLSDINKFQSCRKNINLAKKLINSMIINPNSHLNLSFKGVSLPLEVYGHSSMFYNLSTGEVIEMKISSRSKYSDVKWYIVILSNTQERDATTKSSKGDSLRICGSDIKELEEFKIENKTIIIDWYLINYVYYGTCIKGNSQVSYDKNFENRVDDEEWFEDLWSGYIKKVSDK
jgi:hypothetical protein